MIYSQDPFVEIEDNLAGKDLILKNPRFMLLGQSDKEKRYFVIAFDSVMLENEFNNLKHRYGLNHSHDVFLPHITIAILENESHMKFNVSDILMSKLPVMIISSEKSEPSMRIEKMKLSIQDYQDAADELGVSVAVIQAVASTESRGAGFMTNGKPKILFERHLFHRLTMGKFSSKYLSVSNPTPGGYTKDEYKRLNLAISLDRQAALKSTSWGQFQILGLNFSQCGFISVEEFVKAHEASLKNHLDAFVNFIISNPGMHGAMKILDWKTFAKLFNGPAYRRNRYDEKMKIAYEKMLSTQPVKQHHEDDKDIMKFIQTRLNSLGFNAGVADGILGAKTKNAIAEFEKKNGFSIEKLLNDEIAELFKPNARLQS